MSDRTEHWPRIRGPKWHRPIVISGARSLAAFGGVPSGRVEGISSCQRSAEGWGDPVLTCPVSNFVLVFAIAKVVSIRNVKQAQRWSAALVCSVVWQWDCGVGGEGVAHGGGIREAIGQVGDVVGGGGIGEGE